MDKNLVIEKANKKFNGELLDIVIKQIENYFELEESNYVIENKYQVNDEVRLNKNHLLHGIGKHVDIIENFAQNGIVSQDYFAEASDHAFCYESAFWNVKGDISLKEYIANYSKMIDAMEIRFMPSLAQEINQIGFILNTENEIAQKLRDNSVFKEPFKKEYAMEFVNEKSKNRFKKEGFSADFFERADYIIFGLPSNCIEGVIVGSQVEHNEENLITLKALFPNCYICNLEGKVIK